MKQWGGPRILSRSTSSLGRALKGIHRKTMASELHSQDRPMETYAHLSFVLMEIISKFLTSR